MTEGRSGEERRSLDEKSRSLGVEIEELQAEIREHQETIDRVLKKVPHLEEKWEGLDHLLREGGTPLPKTMWADPGYEWLLADSKYEFYDTSVVEKAEDDFFVYYLLISKDYFTPAEKFAKEEIKKRRGIIARREPELAEKQSELECIPVEAALQRISRATTLTKYTPTDGERYVFCRAQGIWAIRFGVNTIHLEDRKGLYYIESLLQNPKKEIDATDLYRITEKQTASNTPYSGMGEERLEEEGMVSLPELEDPLIASDKKSKKVLEKRLEKIKEEKEEAESFQNWDRVEKLEEEREKIIQYLGSNFGLRGKPRETGAANKARLNVKRAIERALEKIEKSLPALGSHLRSSIRTGYQCSYRPDGDTPISWE